MTKAQNEDRLREARLSIRMGLEEEARVAMAMIAALELQDTLRRRALIVANQKARERGLRDGN